MWHEVRGVGEKLIIDAVEQRAALVDFVVLVKRKVYEHGVPHLWRPMRDE